MGLAVERVYYTLTLFVEKTSDSFEKRVDRCVEILEQLGAEQQYGVDKIQSIMLGHGVDLSLYHDKPEKAVANAINARYSDKTNEDTVALFLSNVATILTASIDTDRTGVVQSATTGLSPLEIYKKHTSDADYSILWWIHTDMIKSIVTDMCYNSSGQIYDLVMPDDINVVLGACSTLTNAI